ncbi:MAG: amino acid deaminase/aldolase [Bacteroidota bacterium]
MSRNPSLPTYAHYKATFAGRPMPFAYVNLDLLDENIRQILARAGGKKIRIASKSVRCRRILSHLLEASPEIQGLMCFTSTEAVWLSQQGFDDLLIAYPTWHPEHLSAVLHETARGKQIILMVDSVEHVRQIQAVAETFAERGTPVHQPVCLDLDMSTKLPGVHFGVFRSPVRGLDAALQVFSAIKSASHLELSSLMGYEAQIAGVGDQMPGQALKNSAVRFLKKRSVRQLARRRGAVVRELEKAGAQLAIVNGGGTGSMETTRREAWVTEITVGSGFYNSHLFDYYSNFRHLPAAGFAIEIVRQPQPGIYTCHGGGYVASGSVGKERLPVLHLPEGARFHPNEAAGEVQTPVLYRGNQVLRHGDPVFLRHSKAGELCERFNQLLLVRDGAVIEEVPTYRGEGQCFL